MRRGVRWTTTIEGWGPDAHKPHKPTSREARREAGRSVGARVDDAGKGGPLWSPAGWGGVMSPQDVSQMNRTRATDAVVLVVRLMPLGRPPGSPWQFWSSEVLVEKVNGTITPIDPTDTPKGVQNDSSHDP